VVAAFPLAFAAWVTTQSAQAGFFVSTMLLASFMVGKLLAGEAYGKELAAIRLEIEQRFGAAREDPP
jgi:hypothetical protein